VCDDEDTGCASTRPVIDSSGSDMAVAVQRLRVRGHAAAAPQMRQSLSMCGRLLLLQLWQQAWQHLRLDQPRLHAK
jgi:hypothetical protein